MMTIGLMNQTAITPATTPIATQMAGKVQSVAGPKAFIADIKKAKPTDAKTAIFSMVMPNIPSTRPPTPQRINCHISSAMILSTNKETSQKPIKNQIIVIAIFFRRYPKNSKNSPMTNPIIPVGISMCLLYLISIIPIVARIVAIKCAMTTCRLSFSRPNLGQMMESTIPSAKVNISSRTL